MEKLPLHDPELGSTGQSADGSPAPRPRAGLGFLARNALLGALVIGTVLIHFGPDISRFTVHSCSHAQPKTFEEVSPHPVAPCCVLPR